MKKQPKPEVYSQSQKSGMKESRSDNTLLSQTKAPSKSKPIGSPLGKTYLSKSHENLSIHQKKKLSTFVDPRPKSSLGLARNPRASNKENLVIKEKHVAFLKPKPVKPLTTIRKASSTQQLDKTGMMPPKAPSSNKNLMMKRAHSTQNVSKDKSTRKRTSAPADVMAYNAELLANFEKEKKTWESRISELIQMAESRKAEIERFKYETKRLKEQIPSHDIKEELEFLRKENKHYQDRLMELGYPVEQITDTEKLTLLQKNNSKNQSKVDGNPESSMRASASYDSLSTDDARAATMPIPCKGDGMQRSSSVTASEPGMSLVDLCGTPEHPSVLSMENNWERCSNKSSDALSEISVACLTERILQMEETHYSTNEELQATLQELTDLQYAVNDLTEENERLADEKAVLLESLCAQTEKLQHCRTQIDQLKTLVISGVLPDKTDREQQLLELLKSAQEEREELLFKQVELDNTLHSTEGEFKDTQNIVDILRDKIKMLEDKISGLKAEKDILGQHVIEKNDIIASDQIEIARYKTMLENGKMKIADLEQLCKTSDNSEVEELLHNTREEKDKLEEKLADANDKLAHALRDVTSLKERMLTKDEELKSLQNNTKSHITDLEVKVDTIGKEKFDAQQELETLREHIDQLEQDCDRYLEEKKNYSSELQELRRSLQSHEQQKSILEAEINELTLKHSLEEQDWRQFQKDLQVAVVIANDFRSETQDDMEKLQEKNASLAKLCNKHKADVDRLKEELDAVKIQKRVEDKTTRSIFSSAELKGKVMNNVNVDKELITLRDGRKSDKNQTQSVKSLIRSIEEQVKSGCSSIHSSSCSSRRNSDSMDGSLIGFENFHDFVKSPTSPIVELPMAVNQEPQLRSVLKKTAERPSPLQRHSVSTLAFDQQRSPMEPPKSAPPVRSDTSPTITSILNNRGTPRRGSGVNVDREGKDGSGRDPLAVLAKQMGGSKRNALLRWCQQKTISYSGVDITNFSSSWNDGLAFCALLNIYLPDKIPYSELNTEDKRRNFTLAFNAAESVGISSILSISDMVAMERPDWQAVMSYVTAIYKHFEFDPKAS
ncbi:hypothetical protein ScPMuIL_005960 [Solemya velum]